MERLKVAVVGLGCRGRMLTKQVLLERGDIDVTAVCDVYEDRVNDTIKMVQEKYPEAKPAAYTSAQKLFDEEAGKLDAVIIASSWDEHIRQAIMAMNAGIPVGMEVGGAYALTELWELVETWERTKTPFMFLENCCYGREELMALNMTEQGVLGEIVHCEGSYQHDLRDEVAGGLQNRHYRLDNYTKRNAENYPTHELGPIARILKLNHGNRMLTLGSVSSKAAGLNDFLERNKEKYADVYGRHFNQGDIVTTTITCAGGETITLTLDTTLPRYYSRGFTVHGTRGLYREDNHSIFLDSEEAHHKADFKWRDQWGNIDNYREAYEHPLWREFLKDEIRGGHGGMDWLLLEAFFTALRNHEPMPIDVYDAASWMVITCLSEESIALGGQRLPIPDFTRGRWIHEKKTEAQKEA